MKRFIRPGHWIVLVVISLTLIPAQDSMAVSFTPIGVLPGNASNSRAWAISADGTTVVGSGGNLRAFKWTVQDGILALPRMSSFGTYFASGVSADGTVVTGGAAVIGVVAGTARWVGNSVELVTDTNNAPLSFTSLGLSDDGLTMVGSDTSSGTIEAAMYSQQEGLVTVNLFQTEARGVSGDGQVMVGISRGGLSDGRAFKWTRSDGLALLGDIPFGNQFTNARAASFDGSVIVGVMQFGKIEAFRWENGVMTGIGDLAGGVFRSEALGVSADGSVIVGAGFDENGVQAMVWDEVNQMRSIRDILTTNNIDLTGWQLQQAIGVSNDGTIIVGRGINPAGLSESWVVDLSVVVPEPTSVVLLAVGMAAILRRVA